MTGARGIAGALILCAVCISGASAGTVAVPVLAWKSIAGASPTPALRAPLLDPKQDAGVNWHFGFKSAADVAAPLTVEVTASGYTGSSMTFDIPYYRDGPAVLGLGGALANDELSGQGELDFLSQVGAKTATSEVILTNTRARRLWEYRANFDPPANVLDARVAFWLVQSSAELVRRQFLRPDQSTLDAKSKLEEWSKTQPGFFGPQKVDRNDLKIALATLDSRDAVFYTAIIEKLGKDLDPTDPEQAKAACVRFEKLKSELDHYSDADGSTYTGYQRHLLLVSTGLATCRARANTAVRAAGQPLPQTAIDASHTLSNDVSRQAAALEKKQGKTGIVRAAKKRVADLKQTVPRTGPPA